MLSAWRLWVVTTLLGMTVGLHAQVPADLGSSASRLAAPRRADSARPGVIPSADDISALHAGFAHPPDDCRIMMRWWWFGPSATKEGLRRDLEQMKSAGIGGVEVATLYPLGLDDPATGFHNYSFLSDEHIENLRYAAEEARRLGLRVDVTLGSGWPFGGPHIPVTQAAGELRVEPVPAPAGSSSVAVPSLEAGEQIINASCLAPEQILT